MKKEIRCSTCAANWDVMLVHNDEVICVGCFIKANRKLAGYLVHFLKVRKKVRLIDPYPPDVKFPRGASMEKRVELLAQRLTSGRKTRRIYPGEPFGNGIGVPSRICNVERDGRVTWSQELKVIKKRALVAVGRVVPVGEGEQHKTEGKKQSSPREKQTLS